MQEYFLQSVIFYCLVCWFSDIGKTLALKLELFLLYDCKNTEPLRRNEMNLFLNEKKNCLI